jgi:hypothetical protein
MDSAQPPLEPSTDGRESNGRFDFGNRFGKGNPRARRVHELLGIIRDETSDDDLKVIWRRVLEMAKGGDLDAAKLVFDRVLGRVRNVEPEPDDEDSDQPPKVAIFDYRTVSQQELNEVFKHLN